jgi:hypothetical protein
MNNLKLYIVILSVAIFSSSCRVKKLKVEPSKDNLELSVEDELKRKILPYIKTSNFNFQYLIAKAKVNVKREGKDFNLTFNIRVENNTKIWISVNALGGIEVARVLLSQDSVKIIDRLNKQYIAKDYIFLSELLKTNVSYALIQDMMFGNAPSTIDYEKSVISMNESTYQFEGNQEMINYTVNLRKEDFKLLVLNLLDQGEEKRQVEVNYGGFKLIENQNFPFLINSIASSPKESLTLNLEYAKIEKVTNLEFPFNVPKKFD